MLAMPPRVSRFASTRSMAMPYICLRTRRLDMCHDKPAAWTGQS